MSCINALNLCQVQVRLDATWTDLIFYPKILIRDFQVDVSHARSVIEIFDAVSYEKGSAVIRMLQGYLGDKVFQVMPSMTRFTNSSTSSTIRTLRPLIPLFHAAKFISEITELVHKKICVEKCKD